MKVLIVGGTRFFGITTIETLIAAGHDVTIASRGLAKDDFGDKVSRLKLDIYKPDSVKSALQGRAYDVIIDKMGYGSNDIRSILDNASCDLFIHMSTAGVYDLNHKDITESEFDPMTVELQWCTRGEVDYDTAKRQAEAAVFQVYSDQKASIVRSPFVIGPNDYTKRLLFYVEHVINGESMFIDNIDSEISFCDSEELGRYMAFLAENEACGPVNAALHGTVTVRNILDYIEKQSGRKAVLSDDGDDAPYNGSESFSLSLSKAENGGCIFSDVEEKIYPLLDYYIDKLS